MTELLERAVATVRQLPPDMQDDMARSLLRLLGEEHANLPLSEKEAASFDESLDHAARGEFVSEEEVAAIWSKHGV